MTISDSIVPSKPARRKEALLDAQFKITACYPAVSVPFESHRVLWQR